jgi:hypothetical protein
LKVLCSITTNNSDILPLCIRAVSNQTILPDKVHIYNHGKEIVKNSLFSFIFNELSEKNIDSLIIPTRSICHSHQSANSTDFDIVWRLNEDTLPESDVLERLIGHWDTETGAVGGAVVKPGNNFSGIGTGQLRDIYEDMPDIQDNRGILKWEVDYLRHSFIYRPDIVPYPTNLSPLGLYGDVIFSYRLKASGYKIIVDNSITTWYYKQKNDHNDFFVENDLKIFNDTMSEWGYKIIRLDLGLGDHIAFANLVPEMIKKYKRVFIGCSYDEVFVDWADMISIIPYDVAKKFCTENVYDWMKNNNWKKDIISAYRKMYNL